jgi:hypothetical protein
MALSGPECTLRLALGEREACPGPACQLWHDGACILESVRPELARSPALSRHLLELRAALGVAATSDEKGQARSLFHRRLNKEQAAET